MNHRWEDDEFKALEDFCAANLFTYIVLAVSFFSKQVAIRLLSQHLLLEGPNERFISVENYNQLKSEIPFQLEVEAYGGSDGREIQFSPYAMDWCFIGAAEDQVHSPHEKVSLQDLDSMVQLYQYLLKEL